MTKIATHGGCFHSDEALAVFMLKKLPQYKNAEVVRTRDPEILEKCDIVVDVGGKYDPPKWFDHHQKEFTTTFDDNHTITKLSSAGLIYKHFGKEILEIILTELIQENKLELKHSAKTIAEGIYVRVYDNFVEAVDALDNGVSAYKESAAYDLRGVTLQTFVSGLSPTPFMNNSDAVLDTQFKKASDLMGWAFTADVQSMGLGWFLSKQTVVESYNNRMKYDPKGRIMVLDGPAYWKEHLDKIEKSANPENLVLYVIYPTGDSVRVQAVSKELGSFESRKALPQEWRGLRDQGLDDVSKIPGGVFVHASGFIGGNRTFEGALKMAQAAADY